MKKKLLICGATGFIGRNLAESYAARGDYEVFGTCFDSPPYSWPNLTLIKADLTNKADVDRVVHGMDVIIQAAATTSGAKEILQKPYYHVTDNAVMNSLIFRSAFEQGVGHVVFFSCSVMYQSAAVPVKESDFDANRELVKSYFGVGWTKVYIEKMCEFYSRISHTRYTAIRHSNVYGPHDKYDLDKSHVFGATMTKVMTAPEGGNIVVWGTGEEGRDLLYVDDLQAFVNLAIDRQKQPFEVINVGCGRVIAIRDLVKAIINCSGKNVRMEYDTSKPTIPTSLCLDISKAREVFGWRPAVSLEQGIAKTMDWYRGNIDLATIKAAV